MDEGLSHTDATDIIQDRQGYIWVSTLFGLNRFDGYTIKRFYNSNVPLSNAYKNRIICMDADSVGNILLGTEDGFQRFDPRTEKYTDYGVTGGGPASDFTKLITRSTNSFYALTGQSRVKYFVIKGNDIAEEALPLPAGFTCTDIATDHAGHLYISGNNGILQLDEHHACRPVTLAGCNEQHIDHIYVNNDKSIVVTAGNRLFLARPSSGQTLSFTVAHQYTCTTNKSIGSLVQDETAGYWVNTAGCLLRLDKNMALIQEISGSSPVKYINTSGLSKLFIDCSQCLWACSFGNGVHYCDLQEKKFYTVQHLPEEPRSISGSYVRAILAENEKDLWVGTNYNGLNHYDLTTQQVTGFYNTYSSATRIKHDAVSALLVDNDHNLWIGSYAGIEILGPDRKQLWKPPGYEHFPDHVIDAMAQDCFGNIWFGDHQHPFGVIYKDAAGTFQVKYYGEAYFILADKTKPQLWMSSTHGLTRIVIDKEGNILKSYRYQASSGPNALSSNYTYPICKQNDSTYWIGTIGGGLDRLIIRPDDSYTITAYTSTLGIFKDVEGMEIDDAGYIWLAGNGLQRFDPRTNNLVRYDKNDGLQGNSFKVNSSSKAPNGMLFFGGINGLNYFQPSTITQNQIPARPVLTRLSVNNQPPDSARTITWCNTLKLDYLQNNFVISFSAMHYANPLKCRFRYKLAGWDKDWQYTDGKNPGAAYSNLDYTAYTFIVEATNNDGLWSTQQAKISISIIPPWWKSLPARIFYMALFIAALLGIYFYQARWYRLKNELAIRAVNEQQREAMHEQREQLYQQQLQLFTNISHEFRTPLTLIRGPLEKMISQDPLPERAHAYQLMLRNVKRLINLVSELMNFKKVADGAITLQVQPLAISDFCKSLYLEFQALAASKQIGFRFVDRTTENPSNYFDAQVLEKILLNLLNNAFKYTNTGGQVTLELFFDRNEFTPSFSTSFHLPNEQHHASQYIYFLVTDTGIGISKESIHSIFDRYYRVSNNHLGSGVGLALVKSLTQLHKGDISVYSERNKGTEFLVAIPWGKENFDNKELMVPGSASSPLEQLDNVLLTPLPEKNITLPSIPKRAKHILLVEDNEELRTFLRESLEKHYHVYEAADGNTAITIAADKNPDLIISDVMMPGLSGIELCKLIKNKFETSHIPFVILSAKDGHDTKVEGLESGADYYFAKPLSIALLLLTIHNIFEQTEKLKQRYTNDHLIQATELVHSEKDKDFINELLKLIEDNMQNPELEVDFLCTRLNTSRTKLYQKIKGISGQSVGEFIKTIRLKKAIHIMTHEDVSLAEVADRIGLQSSSYFSRMFRKEYNTSPSEFVRALRKGGVEAKPATDPET